MAVTFPHIARAISRCPGRGLGALALLAVSAAQAQPQVATVQEAAQINAGLALQLCIVPNIAGPQRAQMFRQAGFAERVERSTGNSDTTHFFSAPSDSAEAELYYGEMPEHCTVSSRVIGVTLGSAVLDQVVPRVYPGFQRQIQYGPVDPATGQAAQCVSYVDPANPIGLAIGVNAGGPQGGCVETGSVLFYATYRV